MKNSCITHELKIVGVIVDNAVDSAGKLLNAIDDCEVKDAPVSAYTFACFRRSVGDLADTLNQNTLKLSGLHNLNKEFGRIYRYQFFPILTLLRLFVECEYLTAKELDMLKEPVVDLCRFFSYTEAYDEVDSMVFTSK